DQPVIGSEPDCSHAVGVALKRGDRAGRREVPDANGAIRRARDDHPAVGAESDRIDRAGMPGKFTPQVAGFRFPDPDDPIASAGYEAAPALTEFSRQHRARMVETAQFLARLHIPEAHAAIPRAGRQRFPIGAEGDSRYAVGVALKHMDDVSGDGAPQKDAAVACSRSDCSFVRADGDVSNARTMPAKLAFRAG